MHAYDTNRYWNGHNSDLPSCVLVGFSAIVEKDIVPGVQALTRAWFGE